VVRSEIRTTLIMYEWLIAWLQSRIPYCEGIQARQQATYMMRIRFIHKVLNCVSCTNSCFFEMGKPPPIPPSRRPLWLRHYFLIHTLSSNISSSFSDDYLLSTGLIVKNLVAFLWHRPHKCQKYLNNVISQTGSHWHAFICHFKCVVRKPWMCVVFFLTEKNG
jgi:hypothetical protein